MKTYDEVKMIKQPPVKDYKIIQAYLKVVKHDGKYLLNKGNIKKVFYLEELEYDTYPYKPDMIKYYNTIFNLTEKLDCSVSYEENQYIISNDLLDLTVWGETREEAERAFCFSFYGLYQNFAKETDSNLTEGGLKIKKILKELVKGEIVSES